MRKLWMLLPVLLIAGCAPAPPDPTTPSGPLPTSAPAASQSVPMPPSPTRDYHTDIVEYPEGFTPSIEFVDCAPVPNDFVDWMLDPTNAEGHPRRDDIDMKLGAIVTSPSGQSSRKIPPTTDRHRRLANAPTWLPTHSRQKPRLFPSQESVSTPAKPSGDSTTTPPGEETSKSSAAKGSNQHSVASPPVQAEYQDAHY